jgi:hypothetical protein
MSNKQLPRPKRIAVLKRDDFHCYYCGIELTHGADPITGHSIDHVNPNLTEDRDEKSNLVAACRSCNARKKNRTREEYRRALYMAQPAYRAAVLLYESRDLMPTPFDETIQAAITWLCQHAVEIEFAGEREKVA